MTPVPGTELPTFTVSRKEWNARRAAGAVAAIEAARGWPPSVREVAAAIGCSLHTAYQRLQLATSLGLLVHDFTNRPGPSKGYRAPRAA